MSPRLARSIVVAIAFSVLLLQLHVCPDWTHARTSPRDCQLCSAGPWVADNVAPHVHDAPAHSPLAADSQCGLPSRLAAEDHASRAPPRA